MSQLKVDSIVPRGGIPSGSNGGVIQVKTGFCGAFTSTNSSYVDTGLSVSITPSSSSSKFIIVVSGIGSVNASDAGQFLFIVVRDSTTVANQNSTNDGAAFAVVEGQRERYPVTCTLIDAPATTSAVTYKLQAKMPHSQTGYLGRWGINDDYNVNSYMTVYEVSG